MITRAQAEALLTLAESLEACERLSIELRLPETACDSAALAVGIETHFVDDFKALTVRLAVSELVPKSEPVTPELIRRLRELSGEGMMSCNRALQLHHGDFEGALEHLRCEGQLVVRRPGALQPCGCKVRL